MWKLATYSVCRNKGEGGKGDTSFCSASPSTVENMGRTTHRYELNTYRVVYFFGRGDFVSSSNIYPREDWYVMRGILCVTLDGQMLVMGFYGGCY